MPPRKIRPLQSPQGRFSFFLFIGRDCPITSAFGFPGDSWGLAVTPLFFLPLWLWCFRCDSQTGLSEGWPCFPVIPNIPQDRQQESKQESQDEEISSLIHRTNGHLARGSWTELSEGELSVVLLWHQPLGEGGSQAKTGLGYSVIFVEEFSLCSRTEISSDGPRHNLRRRWGYLMEP